MNKLRYSILLLCSWAALASSSCNKDNKVNNPRYMTAKVDSTAFTANTVTPTLLADDTAVTLYISGLNTTTNQKITLGVYHYHPVAANYVIDLGRATASYSAGRVGTATGGEIFVDAVDSKGITGRFNFVTDTGNSAVVTNGTFNVAAP